MKILLIHGPNLNWLGRRDPSQYGHLTLNALVELTQEAARQVGLEVLAFQSNHEGYLIDFIQQEASSSKGIIINAGALTHYSYALYDALVDTCLPIIEVHLSNIKEREAWRQTSVIAPACITTIVGKKEQGYLEAVAFLAESLCTPPR